MLQSCRLLLPLCLLPLLASAFVRPSVGRTSSFLDDGRRCALRYGLLLLLLLLLLVVAALHSPSPALPNPSRPSYYAVDDDSSLGSRPRRQGQGDMMVFDFIRKRAEEGIQQVQNIATKTAVCVLTGT